MIIAILREIIRDTLFRLSKPRAIDIEGFKIFINPRDPSYVMRKTFRAYNDNRVHEPATTELFKKIVKKGDVVVDIGANLGYFSLLASKLGAEIIFACEPERKNYDYLLKNLRINDDSNYRKTRCSSRAISNKEGKAKLYLCPYDSGHHTINQDDGIKDYRKTSLLRKCLDIFNKGKYVEIHTARLDNLITENVDVIKMDCEGAEALALEGMDRILTENHDIKLIIEYFPLLLRSMGSSPIDFINKLLEYKFRIYVIPHDYSGGEGLMYVANYEELMKYCPDKESHLNLYLKKR